MPYCLTFRRNSRHKRFQLQDSGSDSRHPEQVDASAMMQNLKTCNAIKRSAMTQGMLGTPKAQRLPSRSAMVQNLKLVMQSSA